MEPSTSERSTTATSTTSTPVVRKRRRHVLTLEKKLQIIEHINRGTCQRILANAYNVGLSTIKDIVRKKQRILDFAHKSDNTIHNRKSMKESVFKELDHLLFRWFQEQRTQGIPVTGPMLAVKAQEIHEKLQIQEPFTASTGWITRFKGRYGIRDTQSADCLNVDKHTVDNFKKDFNRLIEQYQFVPDQIYNAEKTGIIWKCLSRKSNDDITHEDIILSKERLTILCCANASGRHKLPLALIGKTAMPRSFKDLDLDNLPVHYFNLRTGCMNPEIFTTWFQTCFVPYVQYELHSKKLPETAILYVTKVSSIPDEKDLVSDNGLIFVKFIPASIANMIEPMAQGIIEHMKQMYRDEALASGRWRKYEMKDALLSLANHWATISQPTIIKSWEKLFTQEPDMTAIVEELQQKETLRRQPKRIIRPEFHSVDKITIKQEPSDNAAADHHDGDGTNNDDDSTSVSPEEHVETIMKMSEQSTEQLPEQLPNSISHQQALDAANILVKYMEQESDTCFSDLLTVKQIRVNIKNKFLQSIRP